MTFGNSVWFAWNIWQQLVIQLLLPITEVELQTVDLLSSIFIDWLSPRDSNLVTADTPRTALLPGFIPFDVGIRVEALRVDCTSILGWKIEEQKQKQNPQGRIWDVEPPKTQAELLSAIYFNGQSDFFIPRSMHQNSAK